MVISGSSPLSQLLKLRPKVVELLEISGRPFWTCLDMSVDKFCREAGLDTVIWLRQAMDDPPSEPETDWSREPLYHVVDFLTAEHRVFRNEDLPRIGDLRSIPAHAEGYLLKPENQTFEHFEAGFLEHMHEEEERIFPYILRLEACTRNFQLKPVIHRDTFSLFAASNVHAITEKREKMQNHHVQVGGAATGNPLYDAMEDFEVRLANHTWIETDVLFPRALKIEKRLLERQHKGASP